MLVVFYNAKALIVCRFIPSLVLAMNGIK